MEKQNVWYKIAESVEEFNFQNNQLLEVELDGKKICLANHNGQLKACAAKCPHASGSMSNGYIDALGNIVCPLHRYKFSLDNGRNVTGEGYFLKTFLVEVRNDGVFVRLP
jgi:3-phenylpropionate/trans-cinnamate dioxygenase ferredoxin subunit